MTNKARFRLLSVDAFIATLMTILTCLRDSTSCVVQRAVAWLSRSAHHLLGVLGTPAGCGGGAAPRRRWAALVALADAAWLVLRARDARAPQV